jgi:putative endonuclease
MIYMTTTYTPKKRLGQKGEALATTYLQAKGYKLYQANVRIHHDEIDIIMYDETDKALVFVEVKTKAVFSTDFSPWLQITRRKKQALFRAARNWVYAHTYTGPYRIDVVCIANMNVIEHLVDVGE